MSFAEQLSRLQAFLDADELHEEALDYIAAHGYLTALSICPEPVPEREWIDALFSEAPHYRSDAEREEIEVVEEINDFSAGGMPTRVKCLHALVGHSLAKGPGVNPIGDLALEALEWSPEVCRCV